MIEIAKVKKFKARYLKVKEGTVYQEKYMDGNPALILQYDDKEDGPQMEVLTINMGDGRLIVGDYSEHEGISQALVKAGIVEIVEPVTIGMGTGFVVKLLPQGKGRAILTLTMEAPAEGTIPKIRAAKTETGRFEVLDQDVWRGDPSTLMGFQANTKHIEVSIFAPAAMANPSAIVGTNPVFVDNRGQMYTMTLKIEAATVEEEVPA